MGTQLDIEHIADDEPENPTPYWHVQELTVTEFTATAEVGLNSILGLELRVPFRVVRDRVHYLDLARQPYTPPNPGLHHRNETLTGISDPLLAVHLGHQGKAWSTGGRLGISIPAGRTEPNPFELGRLGLWHQHIQFGTGTWDAVLECATARPLGAFGLEIGGAARLTFYENEHGYQAGDRYAIRARVTHPLGRSWSIDGGLLAAKETAETWDGHVETEGNLGRSDVFATLGVAAAISKKASFFANVQIPIWSEATGEQVDIPLIVSLGCSF